jgi:hypothetical protein
VTAPTAYRQALRQFTAPTRRESAKLKFEVVAGTHEGAVLMLDWADYRIGSSPNADIVLSDPGVAPEHVVLRIQPGGVRIDATGAEVTVGQERLPLLRGRRARLPVTLAVGAAQIFLSDPKRDLSDSGRGDPVQRLSEFGRLVMREPLSAVGVLACFALAITMVAQGLSQTARIAGLTVATSAPDVGGSEHSTSGSAAGLSIPNSYAPSAATAEEAARELRARLDAAKIWTLRVSATDGRLAVAGKVSKEDATSWAVIQQWFDQTYGGRIVLTTEINATGAARTMPALPLQAIWYGDHPYIVTADGERYYEGAVLDNGWVLREIGQDRLLLANSGETVALTYR